MPLNVNQIVNVQLNNTPTGISKGDFGKLALLTQDPGTAFPDGDNGHYVEISQISEANAYWGTGSVVIEALKVFFAQSPRPKSVVIGSWDPDGTLEDALNSFNDAYPNWYVVRPLPPTAQLTADELTALAGAVAAYDKKRMSYTTLNAADIENSDTNKIKILAGKGYDNMWLQYDKNNQKYADISAMARALSVNFSGNRTTITMKFKQEPGITPNNTLTLTEANKCKALGINWYTYYSTFAMLAEGTVLGTSNPPRFWDEVHGLDWFCNAVQTYVFNALATSPTKVPQTNKGHERLTGAAAVACQQAVDNGLVAPGIWYGDEFGTLSYGDRLETGFYIYIPDVDDQPLEEREKREAVVMQIAIKLAGAIHSSDILINFTR
ncbi:DUF3383 family protein [Enterobacter hormaechei]|uniref:Uncharacterized protein n=2 Tax=Loughboroughvirus ZCSE2 TaxID=2734117 RepID=A0A4D6DW47_9CAUD|nr:tail sheath [Salmonella phage ZCSE2]MEA4022380.1 DUF3383 family protein [Enterobacter hormaechei]QMV47846.1 putative sheath protein [Salmonella phage S144]UOK16611.1 putative sheath protein [Salmonella phage S1]WQZ00488.1 tail sheath [Klebsiella phage VB_KpM-AEV23]HBU2310291.1 DUF3383 domain-containing protein [Klebsiella pneumoniae]